MPFEQEKDAILQPHSWETIIALESRRPLEELTSTVAPTALHAIARAFLIHTYHNPTLYSTKHLADCVSTYDHRAERWQNRLAELRAEQEEALDDMEYQQLTSAAQPNYQFSMLNFLHEKIVYYTNLLSFAQKSADETSYLLGLVPVNLSALAAHQALSTLLRKHGVVYTPVSIVETIAKCARFYELLFKVILYDAAIGNVLLENFSEYASASDAQLHFFQKLRAIDCPPLPDGSPRENTYASFSKEMCHINVLFAALKDIHFTQQELEELDAWTALQEDFFEVVPFPFPQPKYVLEATPVEPLPAPEPLALPEPKPLTLNPQKKLKLPKIHKRTTLPNVCKFFYGLSQDESFATVPTTSQGVKALMDKLLTPPFTQLYSSLNKEADIALSVQYKMATGLLGDFFTKFQEKECEAQTQQGLDEIAAFGRTTVAQEDPARDVREAPQDAVAYLTEAEVAEEDLPSQDEILAQINKIHDKYPDGVPPLVYDRQIVPLNEKLKRRQVLDRELASKR